MIAKVRECPKEGTQTLSIEAKHAHEAWAELGEWADEHRNCWIRSANLHYETDVDEYHMVAYYVWF